jgi:hypothetical protein
MVLLSVRKFSLELSKFVFDSLEISTDFLNCALFLILLTNLRPEFTTGLSQRQENWLVGTSRLEVVHAVKNIFLFRVLSVEIKGVDLNGVLHVVSHFKASNS